LTHNTSSQETRLAVQSTALLLTIRLTYTQNKQTGPSWENSNTYTKPKLY